MTFLKDIEYYYGTLHCVQGDNLAVVRFLDIRISSFFYETKVVDKKLDFSPDFANIKILG